MMDASFLRRVANTFALAVGAALLAVLVALFMAYGRRRRVSTAVDLALRLPGMGDAVPAPVHAVGVVLALAGGGGEAPMGGER